MIDENMKKRVFSL